MANSPRRRDLFVGAVLLSGLFLGFASPAQAVTTFFKFYSGGTGYTGPYSGAGSVYQMTDTEATTLTPSETSSSPCGSGDICGDPLHYTGVTATAPDPSISSDYRVWHDLAPTFAGLGVIDELATFDSSADQIEGPDVLQLVFSNTVLVSGMASLFDGAHTPFGAGFATSASVASVASTIKFQMRAFNSGVWGSWTDTFFQAANLNQLAVLGSMFQFRQLADNPSFYLSALAVDTNPPEVPGVPIPGALPLFASGLGLLWFGRRRAAKMAA